MSNNKKQMAVEWFNQQIIDKQNGNGDSRSWDEILEQAKKMEHNKLIESYYLGINRVLKMNNGG